MNALTGSILEIGEEVPGGAILDPRMVPSPAAGPRQRRRLGPGESVRFLAPFDPIVWDRQRFEHFWGWQYRFEAYVPATKRRLGYYALPLLYGDRVIGWGNLRVKDGQLNSEFGFVARRPRDRACDGVRRWAPRHCQPARHPTPATRRHRSRRRPADGAATTGHVPTRTVNAPDPRHVARIDTSTAT